MWETGQLQVGIPNNGVVSGLLLVFIKWYQVSKGVAQVSRDVPSVFLWLVFATGLIHPPTVFIYAQEFTISGFMC